MSDEYALKAQIALTGGLNRALMKAERRIVELEANVARLEKSRADCLRLVACLGDAEDWRAPCGCFDDVSGIREALKRIGEAKGENDAHATHRLKSTKKPARLER